MKTKNFLFTILATLAIQSTPLMAQNKSVEQVVQTNLDFYNKRDIEGFMASFHNDIKIYSFGNDTPTVIGTEQVRKLYQELFNLSPNLHSTILKRIVFDNKIIDHESIVGRRGAVDRLELVLIYEVKEDKIIKITVIRK